MVTWACSNSFSWEALWPQIPLTTHTETPYPTRDSLALVPGSPGPVQTCSLCSPYIYWQVGGCFNKYAYYQSEDSLKSVVICLCIVKLHRCKKVTHWKSMVKPVHKRRRLHLLVNSQHYAFLMSSKRYFSDTRPDPIALIVGPLVNFNWFPAQFEGFVDIRAKAKVKATSLSEGFMRESNLKFTLSSDKDHKEKSSLSHSLSVNEP